MSSRYSSIARSAVRLLRSPQGKRIGAKVVDGAAGLAGRAAGPKHAAKVEKARDAAQRGLAGL